MGVRPYENFIAGGRGGIGSSDRRPGFMDYADQGTQVTPVPLPANTWVDVPNDGSGATTNLSYPPDDVSQLLDTSTGRLDFSDLLLGDQVYVRPDFFVTPDQNNATLEFRFVIGDEAGGNEYFLRKLFPKLDSGTTQYQFALDTFLIYIGDANTRDFGAKMQLRLRSSGEFSNAGVAIGVIPGR